MYIKLTRFDNRPVWLNASFIVTVEPRRDGNGAVVVPIGDGLDYDVRESPEQVLRMLEGAPEPKVVPVPVSDCLTKTPADVSPEPEPRREEPKPPQPVEKPAESAAPAAAAEEKPKRKPRAKAKTASKAKATEKKPAHEEKAEPAPVAKPPVLELSDTDIVRLKKLAPKSLAKLKNTLATQFRVADVGGNVAALEAKGAFAIDGNRIVWKTETEIADW